MTDPVDRKTEPDFDQLRSLWQTEAVGEHRSIDLDALIKKQALLWWRMRILAILESSLGLAGAAFFFSFAQASWPGPFVGVWGGVLMLLSALIPILSRQGSWRLSDGSLLATLETERRHHIAAIRYFKWTSWLTWISIPLPIIIIWRVYQRENGWTQDSLLAVIAFSFVALIFVVMPFWTLKKARTRKASLLDIEKAIADQQTP